MIGSSKWKYQTAAILYALLMIYLLFASVMCAIVAARQGGSTNSLMLFSVVITYGCKQFHDSLVLLVLMLRRTTVYVASSILAFDPWHILTSSGAYLLLSPTFINILSMCAFSSLLIAFPADVNRRYAFSNLDDVRSLKRPCMGSQANTTTLARYRGEQSRTIRLSRI